MADQEVPESSYYPAARVALTIRFDDPARKRFNRNPLTLPVTKLKSKFPLVLDFVEQPDGSVLLVPKGQKNPPAAKLRPSQLALGGDLLTQGVSGIIPLRASLSLNGIRTASTLSLEIPFADMPIEPRMVRGIGVDFYLGTFNTATEFAAGVRGESRYTATGGKEAAVLLPVDYVDGFGRKRTNLRFTGWADDWEIDWSSNSVPVVRMNCRDNSSILIDTEAPPLLGLDPNIPIDKAIVKYLQVFPQFAGISVQFLPKGVGAPTYKKASAKVAYKTAFGPPSITGGGKSSVLDYISDIVSHLGLVARFDGTIGRLYVQPPRTIYSQKYPKREDDPFARTTGAGRPLPFRLFVYGRNIDKLVFKRKFTQAGPTTIEVRSYSSTLKRYLIERYPVKKDRQERGLPGTLLPDEKIQQFFFPGIKDGATLRAVAQSIYEQLGRNELEVNIATRDLGSFGGSSLDPDLLDCKPGDTIQLEVSSDFQTAGTTFPGEVEKAMDSFGSAAGYMRSLGYSDEFAEAYARARENATTQPYFRVKRMDFTWDVEKGIDINVQGINYIEVRGDSLPKGEEIEPEKSSAEIRIISLLRGGGKT